MSILLITQNEFKKTLRNKKKLLLTLLIPTLVIVLTIGLQSIMKPSINLGIIYETPSVIGEAFEKSISTVDGVKIHKASPATVHTDMIMAKYAAVITFNGEVSPRISALDIQLEGTITKILNQFISSGELYGFTTLLRQMDSDSMTVAERSVGLILLTLMVTSTLTACNFLKDQEEGILRRYKLAPTYNTSYILGNFIFNFLLTLTQILLAALMIGLLNLQVGISLYAFFSIGLTIAFITSSLSTLLASLLNSELQASLTASSFALIISLLGGAFLPLDKMPDAMKLLSNLTFTKWLIAFTTVVEKGTLTFTNTLPLFIIILMGIAFLASATHFSKRKFSI